MTRLTRPSLDQLPEQVDFAGANNFRDMGGYPLERGASVRRGYLYRSDHLAGLTSADQLLLTELRLKTVVDLRRQSERSESPDCINDASIRQIWMPVRAEGADVTKLRRGLETGTIGVQDAHDYLVQANVEFVRAYAPVYREFIDLLLDPDNYPLVFHCSAGKDRAGFAAVVTLLACGASMDTVFHDYLATNRCTAHYVNGIIDGLNDMPMIARLKASPDAVRALMEARVEYLQAAFDTISSDYGSTDAFLAQALGIDDQKRSQLCAILSA